ncbi:puratrophin-1-like [Stegodyphus dumicola]|uniref:puratrophin-1-like n=1 Tax=Stegodyphus dumicola TaxID=202533 RepID=UPI0015AD205D|nr:puratrophin-1-like [Stegodyphus dumicola]
MKLSRKPKLKSENRLLCFRVERLQNPPIDCNLSSPGSTDSSNSENAYKKSATQARLDTARGPVPVNSHLMSPTSPANVPDISSTNETGNDTEAKSKKTLMLIMKELIQTERDYVKSLEYIIENYIPEFLREDIPQALRGQRNVVFGNIEKIYEFHNQYFLTELEHCENSPFTVGQCFLDFQPQFYLYALYNKNKPKSDALMSEYGNVFFRKKQLELQDKMDLASYLLKPVQRMGKYALLLKQLLKECPERETEHKALKVGGEKIKNLQLAEEMVRFQLRHGNDLLAMDALKDCDVNVKEQGRLLRQDEFIVWQGRSRKCMRHVFLFEDLILFSKARRDPQRKGYEMYQYKHSIKTTDLGMTEQVGDSPTKFEIWFRKRKLNDTFLLQAPNPEVKAAWVTELRKILVKQAVKNRENRLAEMSSMGIGNKPCLDIKPSEDQISDRSISIHQLARAPRFRNSIAVSPYDIHNNRNSIISVSSSSSSGSSQSSFSFYGTLNLGFEPGDSPRPLHRSLTQQSQCSTESGFCTDASTAGDTPENEHLHHKRAERSDSLLSSDSLSTNVSPTEAPYIIKYEQSLEESLTTSM